MHPNTIIVYHSKTGFTERYARQLAEETGAALLPLRNASAGQLAGYDTVVFGTRAHAGRIDAWRRAQRLFAQSGARRLVLFVTGAAPADARQTLDAFWRQNLSAQELAELPHFYLPGGLCYEKMGWADRTMMRAVAAVMRRQSQRKPEHSVQDAQFERMITQSFDLSSPDALRPLAAFLREEAAEAAPSGA